MTHPDDGLYRGDPPPTAGPGPAAYGHPGYAPPRYAQPGYGPPGYAPPGYAPPGWGAPGTGPGWRRPTNTTAILSLVFAFLFAPAGLVLGVVARRQIRRTGEEGDGLALAGIIVGGLVTALWVLGFLAWVAALASISSGSLG